MAKKQTKKAVWAWVFTAPKLTDLQKKQIEAQFQDILQLFTEKCANEENEENDARNVNYVVGFYAKWYRSYLYLCAKYRCPSHNAIAPHFESKFARMEMMSTDGSKLNICFQRYTGEWVPLMQGDGITIEQAKTMLKEESCFHGF